MKSHPNCDDCATRLLNSKGYLWNGTPITHLPDSNQLLSRKERSLRRQEANHNQKINGAFVSLEELSPDAKIFIPAFV